MEPAISPIKTSGKRVVHVDQYNAAPSGGSPGYHSGSKSARGHPKESAAMLASGGAGGSRTARGSKGQHRARLRMAGMAVQGVRRFQEAAKPAYGSYIPRSDAPGPGAYGDTDTNLLAIRTRSKAPAYGMGAKEGGEPNFVDKAARASKDSPGAGAYDTAISSFGHQAAPTRSVYVRSAKDGGGRTAPAYGFAADATGRMDRLNKTQMRSKGFPGVDSPGPAAHGVRDSFARPEDSGVGITARARAKNAGYRFSTSPRF